MTLCAVLHNLHVQSIGVGQSAKFYTNALLNVSPIRKTHNMVWMTIQERGRAIGMLHGGVSQRKVHL